MKVLRRLEEGSVFVVEVRIFNHGVMKMEVVGSASALVGWYGMVVVAVTRDV